MNDQQTGTRSSSKSKSYTPEEEHQLIAFVLDECDGHFSIEEARDIAARLSKKTASIVAKARSLALDYRTEAQQKPAMQTTEETTEETTEGTTEKDTSPAVDSMDWLDAEHWSEKLSHLAEAWRLRGQESLWSVRKGDLLYRLRVEAASIRDESLFDSQEIETRREALLADLESSFLESMTSALRVWPSLFRPRIAGLDTLEARYRKKGRLAEYEAAVAEYRERAEQIATKPATELFDRSTITERRLEQMVPARRAAFEAEVTQIEAYDRFIETLDQLPEEEIDVRLEKLRSEFLHVRRARAWAFDFARLVNDVTEAGSQAQGGGNEPPVRVLQNDFFLVMEQRLTLYWRLHQLREKAFAESRTDIIRRLSYLESGIVSMYRRNENPDLCDRTISDFLDSLEKPASQKTTRQADEERAALLKIDHRARQTAWAEFKLRSATSTADITRRFNELKDIVRFTPEWMQEYWIFRAELLLQRSMDASRKNSTAELDDVRAFIHRIVTRIESEIEVDILYRTLEQQLTAAGDVGSQLLDTNREIAEQIKARNLVEIQNTKRAFLASNGVSLPGTTSASVVSMHKWRA